MNTQCSTAVSLTDSTVHLSPGRSEPCQLSLAVQRSHRWQNGGNSRLEASAFERFLHWLGPDPDTAGRKYESIRGRLILMFRARRCAFAEDLADATFERIVRKLTNPTIELTGDPVPYFFGVAKKIYLEYQRENRASQWGFGCLSPANTDNPDLENMLKHLDEALNTIQKAERELILRYYTDNGKNKVNHRRALAEQFGIRPNALRLRVFRIRRKIKNYMVRSTGDALALMHSFQCA